MGRFMRALGAVLLVLLLPLGGGARAQPPTAKRVALVIGNSAYKAVERLVNPSNDAKLIAETLQTAGFTLIGGGPQLDLDKSRFERAVQSFGRALPGADVALFYYSGHGMQVQGVNWLVPVDANPTGVRDLDFQMIDAGLILRQMEHAGTKLNLLILDACRNNPFAVRGVRGGQSGLAEMRAPEGTLISYATQPGNVAADGAGQNSPYTAALAAAMRRPGLDVFQVFNQVGLSVKQGTAGQQQPWFASSPISGNFYFFTGPVTIMPPPAAPAVDADAMFWQSVAGSKDARDFQAYLRRFPDGTFADLARRRVEALNAAAGSPIGPRSPDLDGLWEIVLSCSDLPDGIRGWRRGLLARVQNGVLHAESGPRGQPTYMVVDGSIGADGRALLDVRGLFGDAAYDGRRAAPGTPYHWQIESRFDGAQGVGTRTSGRPCSVVFTKR